MSDNDSHELLSARPPTESREYDPVEVGNNLISSFQKYREELDSVPKNETNTQAKPRVCVIVSLFEDTGLTEKMFGHALQSIVDQAFDAEVDLDIIAVTNNGGGKGELGNKLKASIQENVRTLKIKGKATEGDWEVDPPRAFAQDIQIVETTAPEDPTPSAPWNLQLSGLKENIHGNRFYLVNQPQHEANKGKIRAIRDVTTMLMEEYKHGYQPESIFQIDAETVLEYYKINQEVPFPPLKVLRNNLTRNNLQAVGTKDNFVILDTDTGLPSDKPLHPYQTGYMETNDRDTFVTLPGGALMARPITYLAGMKSISEHTPGVITEDFLFTELLRVDAKQHGRDVADVARSLSTVSHRNNTPQKLDLAYVQLKRWHDQALAVDDLFPDHTPYSDKPMMEYVRRVVNNRITSAFKQRNPRYVLQLLRDLKKLPQTARLLNSKDRANLVYGDASWSHSK